MPVKEWCWARVLFVSTTVQLGRSVTGANGASPSPPGCGQCRECGWYGVVGDNCTGCDDDVYTPIPEDTGSDSDSSNVLLEIVVAVILPLIRTPTPTVINRLLRGLGLPFPDTFFWNLILYISEMFRGGAARSSTFIVFYIILQPGGAGWSPGIMAEPRGSRRSREESLWKYIFIQFFYIRAGHDR